MDAESWLVACSATRNTANGVPAETPPSTVPLSVTSDVATSFAPRASPFCTTTSAGSLSVPVNEDVPC
ncbi:hypothetical protein COEX109129_10090 [Corallococcus exiguus]